MSDSWCCWSTGQSCTVVTVTALVFAALGITRVRLWWSLVTRWPLEPLHLVYRSATATFTCSFDARSFDFERNSVNRLLVNMWPRVKCHLALFISLSFTGRLFSTRADEKAEITSTLPPPVPTSTALPPPQVVICQPPIDLTVDSTWLEKVVFGNFRVWHVMFSTIAVFTCITVVLCCLFRCRIPRTKQEIEADFIRKRITKSFRSHLNKIKLEELEFDPENLLPVFQKVENLEETRVSKHKSFEKRKLTWKQKLKQFFSGKELSFDNEFGDHGDEQKGNGATSQPMTREEMEKVEKEVECAKIDSTAFNVISDQIAILSYFESDKTRRKRLKEEKKIAKTLKNEQKKQEKLDKKQKKNEEKGKSISKRKSLIELNVDNLEKDHKLIKSKTIDETEIPAMQIISRLEMGSAEMEGEKELEENEINKLSIAIPVPPQPIDSTKKSIRFSFRDAVSSLISKGFRRNSPKEKLATTSSTVVDSTSLVREAMVINIEMIPKQAKDADDKPSNHDATIPQIHVPGDDEPFKLVPTSKKTKIKLHKTESIDRNRLQIPEISMKEMHPERSKEAKYKPFEDKKHIDDDNKTLRTDISHKQTSKNNLKSQNESKPKAEKKNKVKEAKRHEIENKTQIVKINQEKITKNEFEQKKTKDQTVKFELEKTKKEKRNQIKSKLKIEESGQIMSPLSDKTKKVKKDGLHTGAIKDGKKKEVSCDQKRQIEAIDMTESEEQQSTIESSQTASVKGKEKQISLQADTARMSPLDSKLTQEGHEPLHKDEVVIHLELKPKMSSEVIVKETSREQVDQGVSKRKKKGSKKAKSKPNKEEFDRMVHDLNAELKQKLEEKRQCMLKRSQTIEESQLHGFHHSLPDGETSHSRSRNEFKKRLSEVLMQQISNIREADVVKTPPQVAKKPKVVRKQTTISSSEIEIPVEHIYTSSHGKVSVEMHPSSSSSIELGPESILPSSLLPPTVSHRVLPMLPLRAEHSVERFAAVSPTGKNSKLSIERTRDVIFGLPRTSKAPTGPKGEVLKKVTLQEVPQEMGHLPTHRTSSKSRKTSDHHEDKHKKSPP